MRFPRSPFNVAVERLLALLAACSLVACAVVAVDPEIRFTRLPTATIPSESAAIVGFFIRISEGPLLYNVGVRIVSVDGVDVPAWQGAVFQAGPRKIVVKFDGTQSTANVTLTLNARPNHQYLVRTTGSAITDRSLPFWVEDVATREVVLGGRPASVPPLDATPKAQAVYNRFRMALVAAGT